MANKTDVVAKLASTQGISKVEAEKRLDASLEAIMGVVTDGSTTAPDAKGVRNKLIIVGFGTFELKAVPEREFRNPQDKTGTIKVIKVAHNEVKFDSGKLFEDMINS